MPEKSVVEIVTERMERFWRDPVGYDGPFSGITYGTQRMTHEQLKGMTNVVPVQGGTSSLLEQKEALARATQERIGALLAEREQLALDTEARLKAIAEELKALGWHRSRAAREMAQNVADSAK